MAKKAKPAKKRKPIMGTLEELGEQMVKSFKELTPEQQAATRKAIYEKVTGKPYRKPKR